MMIKSALYMTMYGVIAGSGWFFYDSLENNEQPITQLQESYSEIKANLQSSDQPTSGIYRWKNEDGGWEYGNKLPEHLKENELALLKTLPQEVLPINSQQLEREMNAKNDDDTFIIPGIPSLKQVSKLLDDATDIQAKLDHRQEAIDRELEDQ